MKHLLTLAVVCIGIASLGDDCDDKKKESAPAASSTPPTPEKIAGMGEGAVKICAIPKVEAGESLPLHVSFDESSDKPVDIVLKKTDKGYCEYWRGESLSRLWWNGMRFESGSLVLTEVGVYYLKEYKETPTKDDVSYAKAALISDSVFALNVRVISGVPSIEVHTK